MSVPILPPHRQDLDERESCVRVCARGKLFPQTEPPEAESEPAAIGLSTVLPARCHAASQRGRRPSPGHSHEWSRLRLPDPGSHLRNLVDS